jgi:hypothetical protein
MGVPMVAVMTPRERGLKGVSVPGQVSVFLPFSQVIDFEVFAVEDF